MDAVEFDPISQKAEFVQKPKPKIRDPFDVLIRVLIAGISKKDVEIVYSAHNVDCGSGGEPFTMGQEFIGIVLETGMNVTTINKDDKVVVNPFSACGLCSWCRSGRSQYCTQTRKTLGLHKDGGWAQFAVVAESQVYKIPHCLTFNKAIFTDNVSRLIHGLEKIPLMFVNQRLLIAGAGISGILCAAILHFQGYRNVTVSEANLARLEIVEKMELEFECVTPKLLRENSKNDPKMLFDVIIDTTRNPLGISDNISLINFGGKMCIFGGERSDCFTTISPHHILKHEITIIGTSNAIFNYDKALTILTSMGNRYLDFENLCVKVYELKEFKNALKHVHKGCVVKGVYSIGIQCLCTKWKEKEEERKKEAAAAALALLRRKIKELELDY